MGLGIPFQAAFHSSAHSMAAALPTRKPSRATGPSSSNRSTTQSTSSANSKIPLKNHNITAAEVLVISATGESLGVQPILQAMKMFDQALNDLVVVSSTQTPPVCRIIPKKKPGMPKPAAPLVSLQKNKAPSDLANAESADTHRNLNADSGTTKGLAKKRTGAAPVKELEINSTITAHDLQTKMKKGSELLRKGCHLRLSVVERGNRQSAVLVRSVIKTLEDAGKLLNAPTMANKKTLFMLVPIDTSR
ncbi:hypothetical protein BSLG_003422 [Batrachochytrium salamandrivorans]|nr:hypothetical protein BSLG_003422 [Batrachochytrium salamandrivorans]